MRRWTREQWGATEGAQGGKNCGLIQGFQKTPCLLWGEVLLAQEARTAFCGRQGGCGCGQWTGAVLCPQPVTPYANRPQLLSAEGPALILAEPGPGGEQARKADSFEAS